MVELREYESEDGVNHFNKWFNDLNAPAAAKVTTHLTRISNGNFSNVEGAGKGVYECKINFGPGYRVYFGKDGDQLIILLVGGTKKRQQKNVDKAQDLWDEYKKRKSEEKRRKRGK